MGDLPRDIAPELVEVGDTVTVTYAKRNGIVQTMTGVVAERHDQGSTRRMLTAERAILFAWTVGGRSPGYTLTLIKRPAVHLAPLWGDDELRERIA